MKTLCIGHKVNISLPFALLNLIKLAALLAAIAFSSTVFSQEAGDRMSSIWFKSFNYTKPARIMPVKLASFNASIHNQQVLLN